MKAKPKRTLRPWSDAELDGIVHLREQGKAVEEIATLLGRPAESVYSKCKQLLKEGRISSKRGNNWSEKDLKLIHDLSLSSEQVASAIGRTRAAVQTKRTHLGLNRRPPNPWTEDRDAELVSLRNKGLHFREIAQLMGRTESAISNRISGLIAEGILVPLPKEERSRRGATVAANSREDRWRESESEQLISLWNAGLSSAEISKHIERTESSINNELAKRRSAGDIPLLEQKEKDSRAHRGMIRRADTLYRDALAIVNSIPRTKTSGYVIGVIYGDGFITIMKDRGSIGLKSTNESFCRSFAQALEETFGIETRFLSRLEQKKIGKYEYKDVRYYEAFLHNVYIASAIRKVFGLTDEQSWHADDGILEKYGAEFVDGLIQGFFDAEGSYMYRKGGGYYTTACSMNERGMKSIHRLLCLRNYPATISSDKRGQWKTGIHRQEHVLRFAREIGSRIDYKSERMNASLLGLAF